MSHRTKAIACFSLALLLCLAAFGSDIDPYPLWLAGLQVVGVAALGFQGVRQLRLHHYYEGRRTVLVIDYRRGGASRR